MPIPIEKLHAVKKIISHENAPGSPCPDGRAAALLAQDALPEAEVIFLSYDDPAYLNLVPEPGMLFVDIAPPVKGHEPDPFFEAGALVLDHHVTRKDQVLSYERANQGHYGLNEQTESGAWLVFKHVWAKIGEPVYGIGSKVVGHTKERHPTSTQLASSFAALAAIRDTWQKTNSLWKAACEQAEALRFWPWEDLNLGDPFDAGEDHLATMMQIGPVLYAKRLESAKQAIATGHFMKVGSLNVLVINSVETSDAAEVMGEGIDILVGFKYKSSFDNRSDRSRIISTPSELILSLRSRNDTDVGAIAKRLGGGGHKNAAGVVLPYTGKGYGDPSEEQDVYSVIYREIGYNR